MSSRRGTTVVCLALFLFCFLFSATLTRCQAQSDTAGARLTAIAIQADNSGVPSHHIHIGPGQLTVTNETLGMLIREAYKLDGDQISGAPAWLSGQHYDIAASFDNPRPEAPAVESETDGTEYLRAVLSDRFKLAAHRETRLITVYALKVVEGGAKLQEPASPSADSDLRVIHVQPGRIVGREVPVQTLANLLSGQLDHPVLDETGLRGHYQIAFEWEADPSSPMPALSQALQDQLGLKLELERVPREFLVIDHVETPSDN